jgi:hypothetical protein
MDEKKTYFVSGHLDLSELEFEKHYRDILMILAFKGNRFVVGDARGADTMAQRIIASWPHAKAVVYHIGDKPRNNAHNFPTMGGFKNDELRDKAMTAASDDDIAWVRSEEENKKLYKHKYVEGRVSGTMKNIIRRREKNL